MTYRKARKGMENIKGLVFHTIHGSFVDGYGVRTTLFLKGCPLKCVWCCNPEGQHGYPELKVTPELCNGCGKCLDSCPTNAICFGDETETRILVDRKLCTNCLECLNKCHTGALDVFGKYYTVDDVFNILKKDEFFYRASGGGVTIGGGEPSFQKEFVLKLIRKCKENYLHTAIDTCGYTLNDDGFRVLQEADLVLFDLKGMNSGEHLLNTGVSNELILKNLKRFDATGKPIIIRVPIIPNHTDSRQNIEAIGDFLSRLRSIERVDLLVYHEYGAIKYQQLGVRYKLEITPPSDEKITEIKKIIEKYGLKVQLGG